MGMLSANFLHFCAANFLGRSGKNDFSYGVTLKNKIWENSCRLSRHIYFCENFGDFYFGLLIRFKNSFSGLNSVRKPVVLYAYV